MAESITTESAEIPAKVAEAVKSVISKLVPVKTIDESPELSEEVTIGNPALSSYSYWHKVVSELAQS